MEEAQGREGTGQKTIVVVALIEMAGRAQEGEAWDENSSVAVECVDLCECAAATCTCTMDAGWLQQLKLAIVHWVGLLQTSGRVWD